MKKLIEYCNLHNIDISKVFEINIDSILIISDDTIYFNDNSRYGSGIFISRSEITRYLRNIKIKDILK